MGRPKGSKNKPKATNDEDVIPDHLETNIEETELNHYIESEKPKKPKRRYIQKVQPIYRTKKDDSRQ